MVDRHSKFTMLAKVSRKTAYEVEEALITRLSQVQDFVYTITSDNGKEFANHIAISKELEADFYFAHPYHSWERGLNEHTNGLVRQYVPKSTDFDKVSTEDIRKVEDLLNDRPRKVLKFSTPLEILNFQMPQPPPRTSKILRLLLCTSAPESGLRPSSDFGLGKLYIYLFFMRGMPSQTPPSPHRY